MPKISEFFGIVIYMYYREHFPPHFHAIYGDDEALISIENLSIVEGNLSPRVLGLVIEWASINQEKLLQNWAHSRSHELLETIKPLK